MKYTLNTLIVLVLSLVFTLSSCEAEQPTIQNPKTLFLDLQIENESDASYYIKKNGIEQNHLVFHVATGDTIIVSVSQNCWGDCGIISLVSKIDDKNISTDFCSCPVYYKQIFVE